MPEQVYIVTYEDPYHDEGMTRVVSVHRSREGAEAAKVAAQKRISSIDWERISGYEVQETELLA